MQNTNTPQIEVYLDSKFISSETNKVKGVIYGCKTIINQRIGFHVMLQWGVTYNNLSLNCFTWKEKIEKPIEHNSEDELLSYLSYWNSQSSHCETLIYTALQNRRCTFKSRNKEKYQGAYLFTIENTISDYNHPYGNAQDLDAKNYHFIKLDNGYFALSPNTYLEWEVNDWTTKSEMPEKIFRNSTDFTSELDKE